MIKKENIQVLANPQEKERKFDRKMNKRFEKAIHTRTQTSDEHV